MSEICYWSVGNGKYASMLQTLLNSFHAVGMDEDFHVFSDKSIDGAIHHPLEKLDLQHFYFKFALLKQLSSQVDCRYFVYLDADSYFVRKPPSLLKFVKNTPIHAFLESECTAPTRRALWHACPVEKYVELVRDCGITNEKIYNVNAGFFMIKKEAVDMVCGLATDFWKYSALQGYLFTEEPSLAYATQMLTDNPEEHRLLAHTDVWCTDWLGEFAGRLPDGKPWLFCDWMTGDRHIVNPAIIHCVRSKEALMEAGKIKQ